jgi:hypothetical protein
MLDPYASEYANDADRTVVLFGGPEVIVGAGGPDAPAARVTANTPAPTKERTASNATSGLRLALPDALPINLLAT